MIHKISISHRSTFVTNLYASPEWDYVLNGRGHHTDDYKVLFLLEDGKLSATVFRKVGLFIGDVYEQLVHRVEKTTASTLDRLFNLQKKEVFDHCKFYVSNVEVINDFMGINELLHSVSA